MRYPIELRFKKLTLTNETRVVDAQGNDIAYVRQKLLKFKEEIEIFADSSRLQKKFVIKADKVIDWSPTYTIYDPSGQALGSAKREGAKSIFNSTYHIQLSTGETGTLKEENPWVKFIDALIGMVPIVEFFTGYMINPRYQVTDNSGKIIAYLAKRPAFFEGRYEITPGEAMPQSEQSQTELTLLLMLVSFMERNRG